MPRITRASIRALRGIVRWTSRTTAILIASTLTCLLVVSQGAIAPTRAAAAEGRHDHYVDCRSHKPGLGTQEHPWNSLATVVAAGPYVPGDRILLRRGSTCRGHLLLTGSGTAARPITLGAYGTGAKPIVNGSGTSEGTGAVQLVDLQHWIVEDLRITNASTVRGATVHRAGVLVLNRSARRLHGITLQDLTVDHVTSYPWSTDGVFAHGFGGIAVVTDSRAPDAGFDHVRIMRNKVDHVGRSGIITWNHQGQAGTAWDTDVRISGNDVSWAAGDSILLGGAQSSRIDHNVAAHGVNLPKCPLSICPDSKGTASAGIWPIFSRSIRIDHNEAYAMRWGPGDGEGFDIDASTRDVVFEYNYAHDNEGGGLLLCGSRNVTVRFNIFENNIKSALAFIGSMPATGTRVYNNTIYASSASRARPVRYFNVAYKTDITFKNNLVYNYGYATWLWPSRPVTAANTLIGLHSKGRPTDALTSRHNPRLRAPGSGKNGVASLKGYRPVRPGTFQRGVAIPKDVTHDFFGKRINPKHPPRGAAG